MKCKYFRLLLGLNILALGICTCVFAGERSVRIDEVPLYGGMDRQADRKFREGDEKFISKVSKKWGSREAASKAWVDQGFIFYFRDELGMAIRRFNQAWLLDPDNPEVYHGLGSVLYDQGDVCGSMEMYDKGLELEWTAPKNESGFLADAAMMISYCAVDRKNEGHDGYSELIEKADRLFLRAEVLAKKMLIFNMDIYIETGGRLYITGENTQKLGKRCFKCGKKAVN